MERSREFDRSRRSGDGAWSGSSFSQESRRIAEIARRDDINDIHHPMNLLNPANLLSPLNPIGLLNPASPLSLF